VINGSATITSLTISSNATLTITQSAAVSGILSIVLDSKPPPGQTAYYGVIAAGSLTGDFARINATALNLNEGCERLTTTLFKDGNSLGVIVGTVSECGLGPGPIAGISLGVVAAAVLLGLLISKLRSRRVAKWTDAQNARLARERADSARRAFATPTVQFED
jgi:hypothetical protein